MQLTNTRSQMGRDTLYDASGTITTGGTAQLVIPEMKSRSFFVFENNSDTAMYLEIGGPRATAVLTNGVVTSCSVTNAGFNFTKPPIIEFLGGGNDAWSMNNPTTLSAGIPSWPAPAHPAKATSVLTGGAISSIVINDGGAKYANPPYVLITNSHNDPFGCAVPSVGVGFLIQTGGSFSLNGTACTTDPIAVYCATTGKSFTCKYMP